MDELINVVSFNCLFNNLSVQEIIVINLKMGYVNNYCYSTEEISKFLNITKEKIVSTISKVFNICDDYNFKKNIDYNGKDRSNIKKIGMNSIIITSYDDLQDEAINNECKKYQNQGLINLNENGYYKIKK